jgi:hypothetical protein
MFTIFVMGTRRVILAAGFLAGGVMLAGSVSGSAPDKLSGYAYEDTRRLVALVEQAAKLMEEQGENAFSEFGRKGSKCLILCEKINDAEWSRPDIRRIGDGLMADAIAVTASGVFGGVASDTQVVPWLRPLFGSALTLATVLAVGLNLLLRIGGAKQDEALR